MARADRYDGRCHSKPFQQIVRAREASVTTAALAALCREETCMRRSIVALLPVAAIVVSGISGAACGSREPRPGTVQDEAMRAGLKPENLKPATEDYFHDMDANVVGGRPIRSFTPAEV